MCPAPKYLELAAWAGRLGQLGWAGQAGPDWAGLALAGLGLGRAGWAGLGQAGLDWLGKVGLAGLARPVLFPLCAFLLPFVLVGIFL